MNKRILIGITFLLLAAMACAIPLPSLGGQTADDAKYLEGTHHYNIVPTQISCPLRPDSFEGDVLIVYEGEDTLKISHVDEFDVFETYTKAGPNIYERFNSADDLIRIEISATGYILHIIDPDTGEECGYYTFTKQD